MQKTSPHLPSPPPAAGASSLVGQVLLGKYRLQRELGRGGMGVVYAAEHMLLGQQVALKMMLPHVAQDPDAVARFLNEGRAVARLENEHVARIMDVGLLRDGIPFLVLELLEGLDLADMLAATGPMPVVRVVDYLLEAMEAIAEAHCAGIVHRDLKPSNLFVAERKGGASIKVLDFGISKALAKDPTREQVITATNAILGSPAYMSPEQLRNAREIDARADVWSLGVIAYELLTGTLPYRGPNVVELFAVIQETEARPLVELRPDVPARVDEAVRRCLRRKAAERWQSVLALATALAPFGSPGARASLSRIEMLFAEPVSVRAVIETEDHTRARISVPDTDPNDLPSTTVLAASGENPRVVMPSTPRVTRGGSAPSLTRTTGGVAAPPIGAGVRWMRGAAILLALALVAMAVGLFLRQAPRADATTPIHSVSSEPASSPPSPPPPAPVLEVPAAAPPAVAEPPPPVTSARAVPHVTPAAKPASPAPSSKPPPGKGVPAEWN